MLLLLLFTWTPTDSINISLFTWMWSTCFIWVIFKLYLCVTNISYFFSFYSFCTSAGSRSINSVSVVVHSKLICLHVVFLTLWRWRKAAQVDGLSLFQRLNHQIEPLQCKMQQTLRHNDALCLRPNCWHVSHTWEGDPGVRIWSNRPRRESATFLYFASIKLRTLHVYWSEMQLLLRYRSRNTRWK